MGHQKTITVISICFDNLINCTKPALFCLIYPFRPLPTPTQISNQLLGMDRIALR